MISKLFKWLLSFFKKRQSYVDNSQKLNKQNQTTSSCSSIHDDVECVLMMHFHDFIKYASKHYNAQMKLLCRDNPYFADTDDISLAVDYFMRNRNRLFQWWCMNNVNLLSSDKEFQVLKDLYGFNYAFKIASKKLLYVDVNPDINYEHGINVIDDDGNINHSFVQLMKVE